MDDGLVLLADDGPSVMSMRFRASERSLSAWASVIPIGEMCLLLNTRAFWINSCQDALYRALAKTHRQPREANTSSGERTAIPLNRGRSLALSVTRIPLPISSLYFP
jgi:hypothetical protein